MFTSYFAKASDDPNAVAISRGTPTNYSGRVYMPLAPPWELINLYKINEDEEIYRNHYQHLILNNLDPLMTYKELGEDAILLCWEGRNKFCHRRIVADWFERELNIEVPEL